MPQNTIVNPVNAPSRKILITYKKVDKLAIQGNFNLSKSGYNWLEVTEDEILKIEGVTSLKIINVGDEEVKINGIVLLPLPHYDITKNKSIDGSTEFWELIDRAMCRNSKIFVLPDGTYSDITLNIDFLGEEVNAFCDKPHLPAYPQEVVFEEITSYNPLPIVPPAPHVNLTAVLTLETFSSFDFVPNKSGTFQVNLGGTIDPNTGVGLAGETIHIVLSSGVLPNNWSLILVETGEELFYDGYGQYLRSSNDWIIQDEWVNGTWKFNILKDIGTQVRVIMTKPKQNLFHKDYPFAGQTLLPTPAEYSIFKATPAEITEMETYNLLEVYTKEISEGIIPCAIGVNPSVNTPALALTNPNELLSLMAFGRFSGLSELHKIGYTGYVPYSDHGIAEGLQFQRLDTMEFSPFFWFNWIK